MADADAVVRGLPAVGGVPPRQKKGKAGNPPRFLSDMRRVYEGKLVEPVPARLAMLRKLMEESPREFLLQLQRAEAAHAAGREKKKVAAGVAAPVVPKAADAGGERLRELIGRLLAEAAT